MYRKRRLGCCFVGMAEESDQRCLLKLEPFIQRRLEAPQVITQREYFSSENYVKITAVVHPPSPREYRFRIKPEESLSDMSDAATILSTPMLSVFKTLSFTPSVECQLQKVFDFHDRLAFSCRVMHQGGMGRGNHPMSVAVINNAGDIVSTAHLLQRSTLPSWKQVMNDRKGCCTLEDNERAMLIRGSKDWGICIGRWENQCAIKFFSLIEKQEWKSVSSNPEEFSIKLSNKMPFRVDLRDGIIVIPPDVSHVPETIALGFAIAILFVLCQPISNETLYYDPSCRCSHYPTKINIPENLKFAVAAGYNADKFKNHIVRNTCGRCLFRREMEREREREREWERERERERETYSRRIVSNSLFISGGGFGGGGFGGGGCGGGGCGDGGCGGGGGCGCSHYPTKINIPENLKFAVAAGYDADKFKNPIIRTTGARCLVSRRREMEMERERERKTYSRTIVSNSLFTGGGGFGGGGCGGGGFGGGGCDGGGGCGGGGC